MIQDIYPSRLDNSYIPRSFGEDDIIMCFDDNDSLLAADDDQRISFPTGREISANEPVYLFSVDGRGCFLSPLDNVSADGFVYKGLKQLRNCGSGKWLFAAYTAYHLRKWYSDNSFCGRCGSKTVHSPHERSLVCGCCGNTVYPRINPAVIVGVTKGDSMLITRYRRGYAHNALVAGFTEIGETLEQTVEREVMEETGVKVKNIRYYKSQPWGSAQDILVGFFCEAEESAVIHMDEKELRYAEWVRREELVLQPDSASLTNEMMRVFRDKEPPFGKGRQP